MVARVWEAVKATAAVGALIAAALVSADKLDRQKVAPPFGTVLAEPAATGTIAPKAMP